MESEYTFKQISDYGSVYSGSTDCDYDYHVTLPQYMEDLLKIVKCCVSPYVTGYEKSASELKVYGKTHMEIIYISAADNSIKTYVYDEEFSKIISLSAECGDDALIRLKVVKRYDSSRVVNQRRFDVHLSFSLSLQVFARTQHEIMGDCPQLKQNLFSAKRLCLTNSVTDKIDFCEVVGNCEDGTKIKNIINTFYNIALTEINIVQDKALVKARLMLSLTYVTDAPVQEIRKFSSSVEISKIIDVPGISENSQNHCCLSVQNMTATARSDDNGELKIFEAAGSVQVCIDVYDEKEESFIVDAYCPKQKIECSFEELNLCCPAENIADKTLFKSEVSFDGISVSEIIDINVSCLKTEIESNDSVKLKSQLLIELLYKSADGEILYIKKTEHLLYDTGLQEKNVGGNANIEFFSFDYVLTSEHSVELRIDAGVQALLYKSVRIYALKSFEIKEEDPRETPALVIYFSNPHENVWNIAKKFGSDMELIMRENDLASPEIETKRILMIPGI